MADSLFNAGALPVLLDLMPRCISSIEIQVHCCILVNFLLNNCPDAYKAFIALDGLKHLLKASEISSKGFCFCLSVLMIRISGNKKCILSNREIFWNREF
jgi:hypothetical protein